MKRAFVWTISYVDGGYILEYPLWDDYGGGFFGMKKIFSSFDDCVNFLRFSKSDVIEHQLEVEKHQKSVVENREKRGIGLCR